MKVHYARKKWWWKQHAGLVLIYGATADQPAYEVIRFEHHDGNGPYPPGWYARAEWLPHGFRRFPTLLRAFRWANWQAGGQLLVAMPPEVADYEDRTALDGFPVAHREIS